MPLSEFTTGKFLEAFSDKKPGTYDRLMTIVRAALNNAFDLGWIPRPLKFKKRDKSEKRVRWITHEEADRLLEALPLHLRQMAIFSLQTGVRWSNCTFLSWDHVDIDRAMAWIDPEAAKAGKALQIPLNDTCLGVLREQQGEHDSYVFTYRGAPIQSPKTAWRTACLEAKIKNFRWHDLRHTWASWHVQNGTPLPVLKELGGWASMEMVMRYAHLAPGHSALYAGNTKKRKTNVVQMRRKKG